MTTKMVNPSRERARSSASAQAQLEESLVALQLAAKDVRYRIPGAGPGFQKVIFDDLDRRIADVRKAVERCSLVAKQATR
jgi:hypothetical protein